MATLFTKILAAGLNVRPDYVDAMLNAYKNELTQVNYSPEFAKSQRLRKKATAVRRTKQKLDDDALLRKLERFDVPDEKAPPKKVGARRR